MSIRDRIAAVLMLNAVGPAAVGPDIENRQQTPMQERKESEPRRSFDDVFSNMPPMLDPAKPMPPPSPLSRALGSDGMDAAIARKNKRIP